jgi:hypothetical protein
MALVDKHVCKILVESIQILSTAHRILDGQEYVGKSVSGKRNVKRWRLNDEREEILYSATHVNHPSVIWARQNKENYLWLLDHTIGLLDEYQYRYDKVHSFFGSELMKSLFKLPKNIQSGSFIDPPPAMDVKYVVSDDSLENYRNYYREGKRHLFSWKRRNVPYWIE